jgi:hypothetical protein
MYGADGSLGGAVAKALAGSGARGNGRLNYSAV